MKRKILIVEDSILTANWARTVLARAGYEVQVVNRSSEALAHLETQIFRNLI